MSNFLDFYDNFSKHSLLSPKQINIPNKRKNEKEVKHKSNQKWNIAWQYFEH